MNKHVNYSIIKVFFNENGQWDKQVVFLVFYLQYSQRNLTTCRFH